MRLRILPAHVIALACVTGLAASDALRLRNQLPALLAAVAVGTGVPRIAARLAIAAARGTTA